MNLNFFKKINFHKDYQKKTLRSFVLSSWKSIIFTSIIAALIVFAGSFYIYRRVNNGNFIIADTNSSINVKPVDKKSLAKIVSYFEEKKLQSQSVPERKFVDPSL